MNSDKQGEKETHFNTCQNALMSCIKCKQVLLRSTYNSHIKNDCLEEPSNCELCDTSIIKKNILYHLKECPMSQFTC